MADFETAAHQVGTEQRHAAARDAATALVRAAGPAVLDPGHDITRMETVLAFGQDDVSEEIIRAAGCGHMEHVLAAAVMLISELTLRLAVVEHDQKAAAGRGWDSLQHCPSESPAIPVPPTGEIVLHCEREASHEGAHGAMRYLTNWRDEKQATPDSGSNSAGGAS